MEKGGCWTRFGMAQKGEEGVKRTKGAVIVVTIWRSNSGAGGGSGGVTPHIQVGTR